MREPQNELDAIATALKVAMQNDLSATDKDFCNFLHESLAPQIAKRLHKERASDSNVS